MEEAKLSSAGGTRECPMCDYSLHNVKTRPAQVGDKLTTRMFRWSTGGFAASEDKSVGLRITRN